MICSGDDIGELARSYFVRMREVRRYLHRQPELSGDEYRTTEFLAEIISNLGLSPTLAGDDRGLFVDVGEAFSGPRIASVLSYALWHSARFGVTDQLIDVSTCQKMPASDLVDRVMSELDAALDATDERELVDAFVRSVLTNGTGADRQRESGDLADVVKQVVGETRPPTFDPTTLHH